AGRAGRIVGRPRPRGRAGQPSTETPMTRAFALLTFCTAALAPARAAEPVALFDGKDTAKWSTFLRDHGRDKDPNGTFTVRGGVLRVSGQDFGGLVTRDEYANYEVVAE